MIDDLNSSLADDNDNFSTQDKSNCRQKIFECEGRFSRDKITKSEHVINKSRPQTDITPPWIKIGEENSINLAYRSEWGFESE